MAPTTRQTMRHKPLDFTSDISWNISSHIWIFLYIYNKSIIALKIQDINLNAISWKFWPHCDSLLTQKDRLKKTWCQIARQREGGRGGTGSILTRFHILLFFLLSIFSCPRQPNSDQPIAARRPAAHSSGAPPRRGALRRRRQQTLA